MNLLSNDVVLLVYRSPEVRSKSSFPKCHVHIYRDYPVDHDILIQHLQDHERYKLSSGNGVVDEARLEEYLIRGLIDFDDISYDDHAALLYKLAGQVVLRLQSYLSNEEEVKTEVGTSAMSHSSVSS